MDEQTEKAINFMLPFSIAAGSFVLVALFSVTVVDVIILKIPSNGSVLFEVFAFFFTVAVYAYCLHYSKHKLGYFTDRNKLKKHLLLMIIIPAVFGIYSGYSSYKAKKPVEVKQTQLQQVDV